MSALPVAMEPIPPVPHPDSDAQARVSLQEYFALERTADVRHEYLDGYIRAMAGESPRHNRIAGNIYVGFENAFGNRPCESFIENIRVRVSPTRYRYPDVVALCGDALFDTENPPSLLNPQVIIEVLSPSTAEHDRHEKFSEYRLLEGLTDYVLVSQEEILVLHYIRQTATQWVVNEYTRLEDTLTFEALNVSLSLTEIYRKVEFTDASPSDEAAATR